MILATYCMIVGIKKELSRHISSEFIDNIYNKGLKSGALGGKILGAGGGVFFCFM